MAVITISRQFGAGGKTLGEMISKKMDCPFIVDEIIQMLATKAKVSTHFVEDLEKEAGGKFLKFITTLVSRTYVERILDDKRGYIDEEIYVDLLHKIIRQVAEKGSCIILGRGSQYILRDTKDVYHVLLISDRAHRIRFMQENYNLSPREAIQVVEKEEKKRTNLYRKFGKEDFDHPHLYDLVLNMSKIDLEKAADVVCKLVCP
jgi:cytidylate kinase